MAKKYDPQKNVMDAAEREKAEKEKAEKAKVEKDTKKKDPKKKETKKKDSKKKETKKEKMKKDTKKKETKKTNAKEPKHVKGDIVDNKYSTKANGLGKAGAIINIIFATFPLPLLFIFIIASFFTAIWWSWIMLIVVVVLVVIIALDICSIISNAKFLKGKSNKKASGILGLITGSLFGAMFIFCSYRIWN